MPLPTNQCSNCGLPVRARKRANVTGEHYCSMPDCQAAKQRAFRARKKKGESMGEVDINRARLAFFDAALNHPRSVCGCGLQKAVTGYAHRDAPGSKTPCFISGNGGKDLGPGWLDIANPELDPSRPEYIGDRP